jgi:hypothetical protein
MIEGEGFNGFAGERGGELTADLPQGGDDCGRVFVRRIDEELVIVPLLTSRSSAITARIVRSAGVGPRLTFLDCRRRMPSSMAQSSESMRYVPLQARTCTVDWAE